MYIYAWRPVFSYCYGEIPFFLKMIVVNINEAMKCKFNTYDTDDRIGDHFVFDNSDGCISPMSKNAISYRSGGSSVLRLVGILLAALVTGVTSLWAQTPSVVFTVPDSGAVDIELTPTITIEANLKIDSLEVTWGRWDSVNTLNDADSLTPTILVIEKDVYDNEPDSVWNNFAQGGLYELATDSTLTFTPFGLMHATEYVALLQGVALVDDSSQSVLFTNTLVVPFTTTLPAHQVVDVSLLPGDQLSCQDTITVWFNRDPDSVATLLGAILEIERLEDWHLGVGADSTSLIGDSATVLPANLSLGGDGRSIRIVPQNPLAAGEAYRLVVNTSYWTGEPSDDVMIPFGVNSSMKVNIVAASADTSSPYVPDFHIGPQQGESYYLPGDSILLRAPVSHEGWTFVEWQCPDDPSIDGETSTNLTLYVACYDLRPRTITALYEPPADCPILKSFVNTGGKPLLFIDDHASLDLDSLGFVGFWTLCPDEKVVAVAKADSGYVFSHWISSYTPLNGSNKPVLSVNNLPFGVMTTLKPVFTAGVSVCAGCIGNANVIVDDPGPGLTATDVVTLTPNLNGGLLDESQVPGTCPGQVSFTATIKPQYAACYEIYQADAFQEVGGSSGFSQIVQAPVTGNGTTATATMTADCKAWVTYHVRRKRYTLTVEQAKYPESPSAAPLTPEENALVEVRVTSTEAGAIVSSVPGETVDGIRYIAYTIKACASVDILALSHSDEVYFQQYSCLSDVECDADPTDPHMNRTMDHNIKVRALYKHRFRLEKIEFRRHGTTNWEAFSPDIQFVGDVTVEGPKGGNDWKQMSMVRFTFSDPVDLTTVEGNIRVLEQDLRIDRAPLQDYRPSNSTSAVWSNGDRVLTMELKNTGNGIGITKIQLALIRVAGLKNVAADNLENGRLIYMETEYPGLDVTLKQFKTIDIGEPAIGHVHVLGSGYHSVIPSAPPTAIVEQTPIGGNRQVVTACDVTIPLNGWTDPDGSVLRPLVLVDVAQMQREDEIMFGAIAIEIDGMLSCQLTPQTAMLNDARNRIANRVFYNDMAKMWREVVDPFIHSFNPLDDDDENIGEVSIPRMFKRWEHFGATQSSPYLNEYFDITGIEEGKTRFDFIIRFIPD